MYLLSRKESTDAAVCREGESCLATGRAGRAAFHVAEKETGLGVGRLSPVDFPSKGGSSSPQLHTLVIAGNLPWGPRAAGKWTAAELHPLGGPEWSHHPQCQSSVRTSRRPSGRSLGFRGSGETLFYPGLKEKDIIYMEFPIKTQAVYTTEPSRAGSPQHLVTVWSYNGAEKHFYERKACVPIGANGVVCVHRHACHSH